MGLPLQTKIYSCSRRLACPPRKMTLALNVLPWFPFQAFPLLIPYTEPHLSKPVFSRHSDLGSAVRSSQGLFLASVSYTCFYFLIWSK